MTIKMLSPLFALLFCLLLVFPALGQGPGWKYQGTRPYKGQPHVVYQSAVYGNVQKYVPVYQPASRPTYKGYRSYAPPRYRWPGGQAGLAGE